MGTAFTYQGRLMDANVPADGRYDLQFKLFDSIGFLPLGTVDVNGLDVIDGYFTVELDFGDGVFTGEPRWLEIGIRSSKDPNIYTVLKPRQEILPTPYALYAEAAGAGHSLDAADGSPTDAVYVDN